MLAVTLSVMLVGARCGPSSADGDGFPHSGRQSDAGGDVAATFYVDTNGSDATGDGSLAFPWESITHALENVPDGSLVLVRPGTYTGRVRLRGTFAQGVTVRSEVAYQARLRNDGQVVTCFYGQGITLEGFDIAHSGPGSDALVIQIQDLIDGREQTGRIVLRNNVLHDSYNNDILKINNNATDVLVEGNLFYNQEGSDEHIDVNSITDVVIQDNVFFNDGLGSAPNDTSYIVIKDSNRGDDGQWGSERAVMLWHPISRRQFLFGSTAALAGALPGGLKVAQSLWMRCTPAAGTQGLDDILGGM